MAAKLEVREAMLTEKRVCRFCLTEQKLASIFEENPRVKTTANLPLQIMAITAIEVSGSIHGFWLALTSATHNLAKKPHRGFPHRLRGVLAKFPRSKLPRFPFPAECP